MLQCLVVASHAINVDASTPHTLLQRTFQGVLQFLVVCSKLLKSEGNPSVLLNINFLKGNMGLQKAAMKKLRFQNLRVK